MECTKIGDCFCVWDPDTQKLSYGKVSQLIGIIVHFNVYSRLKDFSGGKLLLSHHSKYELIRTEETMKEFVENVVRLIKNLRLREYKQRFPAQQQLANKVPEFYFFRQKFVGGLFSKAESFESRLMPELKLICVLEGDESR